MAERIRSLPGASKKIAIVGTPLSGKTTILRHVAKELALDISETFLGATRVLFVEGHDWVIATLTGPRIDPKQWNALLDWASDALVVVDPQPATEAQWSWLLSHVASRLRGMQPSIQITKCDLAGDAVVRSRAADAARELSVPPEKVFFSDFDASQLSSGVASLLGATR